jgi:hypothetical protein
MARHIENGLKPPRSRVSVVFLLVFAFLLPCLGGNGKNSGVFAQGTPSDTLSVSVSGTYQRSGPSAILPYFNHTLVLNGTTVTIAATVNGAFGSDYNITFGQMYLGVTYQGSPIGTATGNFTGTGPVSFPVSTFSVPPGATMDDLDFSYQSYYTLQFTSPAFSQSFHYSDYYSSGRIYDGGIISGNERYDLNITRPCAQVASFTASPTTVASGNPVTIQWSVNNRFRNRVRITDVTHGVTIGDFPNGVGQTTVNPTSTTTYQIQLVDTAGNPVGCFAARSVEVQVTSGPRYFWIVKRLSEEGVVYPPGAPPTYTDPPSGTPAPGSNDPNSYRIIPDGSTFTAASPDEARVLEPYVTSRDAAQSAMITSDITQPGGAQSPNFILAYNDYNSARREYRHVLGLFNTQTPGYSGPRQGSGSPRNQAVPKWNERVDPWN